MSAGWADAMGTRRVFRECALLCLLALLPAGWTGWRELAWRPQAPLAENEVRLAEAEQWHPRALWVDARRRERFERAHISGAISLSPEEWESGVANFVDHWEPQQRVVVYDERAGDEAATVALRLRQELNIEEVYVLHGGFEAWERR